MKRSNQSKYIKLGQDLDGFVCNRILETGGLTFVWNEKNECKVFETESLFAKGKFYTIDSQEIQKVVIPKLHELIILETSTKAYFRDFENQSISNSENWVDYFYEPNNSNFYRKDKHGNWYDLEGHRMAKPVFIHGNVLCSLLGKTSKKSLLFGQEDIICSKNHELIEVGKLVYDKDLNLVNYLGERVTEIGRSNVYFGKGDSLQEVMMGVGRVGFINEFSKKPYLIEEEEITSYKGKVEFFSKYDFKVFNSDSKSFFLGKSSNDVFTINEKPVVLRSEKYIRIGSFELVKIVDIENEYFVDINSKLPFRIPGYENDIVIEIDKVPFEIEGAELYNVETNKRKLVYNISHQTIFSLDENRIIPSMISLAKGFENYYFFATINGIKKLCYKKNASIIELGENKLQIHKINSANNQRLLNVSGVNNENFVIDARAGFDSVMLAKCDNRRIQEVFASPVKISSYVLQKANIQTLGGVEERVIDLNKEKLSLYTMPDNLTEYPEQEESSIFRSNVIDDIDFENIIDVEGKLFYAASFINYLGQTNSLIISAKNGRPIQLLGLGHRLELVTQFDPETTSRNYNLGYNRMIGAYTLTEDMKEKEILFSIDTLSSWIPFYDGYMPIFRRIVEIKGMENWEYLLFESREKTNESEYIAVEKVSPYRVLVEKSGDTQRLKIIKGENLALKAPERVSRITKFFSQDPGYLVEVD